MFICLIMSNAAIAKTLYFSHIASNSKWETEICLINSSTTNSASGTLTAYDNSGQQIASAAVNLNPGARQSLLVSNSFLNAHLIGYILLDSVSKTILGYTKFYVDSKYRVAIPADSHVNVDDIFIPHIASNTKWWTGISLLNTSTSSKELIFQFSDGSIKTKPIAGKEHLVFSIKSLFDNIAQPDIKSAVIKNSDGVVGLELFGSNAGNGESYLSGILLKDDTTHSIYYPHIASNDKWWTGVVAYNPSTESCNLTITPFQKDGTQLVSQNLSLAGQQKYIGSAGGLNLPDGSAWFKIDASKPISGFELFGKRNGLQLGGYTGVDISGTTGIFPKLEKGSDGWTGIAFVNIENKPSTITISACDDEGTIIAEESLSLSAYEKVINNSAALFSSDIQAATYLRYTSTTELVGFQLNGSTDGMLLDALPGDTFQISAAQLLVSKTIGDTGGDVNSDDFSFIIPQGAFSSPTDLELFRMGSDDAFESDMLTDTFRLTGITDDFPGTLLPSLRCPDTLTDESFIVVGEEVFIPSSFNSGMVYRLFPALLDSGFLSPVTQAAPAGELLRLKDKPLNGTGHAGTSRFLDFSGITGWKTYTTQSGKGHFAIQYPVASVGAAQVESLGRDLETAYDTFDALGFSYDSRTAWPVSVIVRKLDDQEYGLHCPSMWGHNSATLAFNRDKLYETEQIATTAGHEFFHLVQYLYDPRNVLSQAKSAATHHWLKEACAVWAEAKFSTEADYVSDIRAGHETNPFNGMHAGAVSNNAGHHGYGMSAFIKFLENRYGESIIRDIYLQIFDTRHPVEAVNIATGHNLVILWEQFLREYLAGSIYNVQKGMFTGIRSGLFRIQSPADQSASFTHNYPDLSARLFIIRLDDTDISPSKAVHLAIDQDLCDITLFKYSNPDPTIQYLSHSTTKKLIGKSLRSFARDGHHLIAMVTNSNFTEPYTNTLGVTLDITIESMAHAMTLWAAPDTLDADGVSTAAITATVTDDTDTPVEDETVQFSADYGSLSHSSATTDANGIVNVVYTAPSSQPPGGTATVTATTSNGVTQTATVTLNPTPAWPGWPAPQWCPQTSTEFQGSMFIFYPPDNPSQAIDCTFHGNAALKWEIPYTDGKKDGWRKDYFESGALKYQAPYENSKINGVATWYYEGGSLYSQIPYVNGLIEGEYVSYYETGQIEARVPYRSDLKNGTAHWFYSTGARMKDIPWVDDLKHGTERGYYSSGPLNYEHPYTNGKKNGITKGYYENGNRKYESPYVNGKKQGIRYDYYETGELKKETPYENDERHGLEILYEINGDISCETPFQNGDKHGDVKCYDSNGDLSSCSTYDMGTFIGSCMP